MKVVFFGSPDFAVASLEALLQSKHQVLAVVTQSDKPAGRGLQMEPPAVKKLALQHGLPIYQPEKLNTQETIDFLDQYKPDILAVVAYGKFLGSKLLNYSKFAPVNVHPSLLPDLRGAAPMQWALLNGRTESGVTTQFMTKEMDAGDILLQVREAIGENETAKDLHNRWSVRGGQLLVETLTGLENGSIAPKPQAGEITFAPLLTKEQGQINWANESAQEVHNKIRGLYPWPGAYSFMQKKRIKIIRSQLGPEVKIAPGKITHNGDSLYVGCANRSIQILELQPEGKRALLPREFVSGMKEQEQISFDEV